MLTVIVKRSEEPKIIQLTQRNIERELWNIPGSEMLLEDTWAAGIQKVRTPYVCLVEAECTLSASYLSSNFGLIKKSDDKAGQRGGYNKLAMIASCLGVRDFGNRIYNYHLKEGLWPKETAEIRVKDDWHVAPNRKKLDMRLYPVQIGFVPGSIIRMSALVHNSIPWDTPDLIELSILASFHFWNTGRRIEVNPNTTYVSTEQYLEKDPILKTKVPDKVAALFSREGIE